MKFLNERFQLFKQSQLKNGNLQIQSKASETSSQQSIVQTSSYANAGVSANSNNESSINAEMTKSQQSNLFSTEDGLNSRSDFRNLDSNKVSNDQGMSRHSESLFHNSTLQAEFEASTGSFDNFHQTKSSAIESKQNTHLESLLQENHTNQNTLKHQPVQSQQANDNLLIESFKWFYRDPQHNIQGPFSSEEMRDWMDNGYFTKDLLVKRGCDQVFSELGYLYRLCQGSCPFKLAVSSRQGMLPHMNSATVFPPPILSNNALNCGPNEVSVPVDTQPTQAGQPSHGANFGLNDPAILSSSSIFAHHSKEEQGNADDTYLSQHSPTANLNHMYQRQQFMSNLPSSQLASRQSQVLPPIDYSNPQVQNQILLILSMINKNENFRNFTIVERQQLAVSKYIEFHQKNALLQQQKLAISQQQEQYVNSSPSPNLPTEVSKPEEQQIEHSPSYQQQTSFVVPNQVVPPPQPLSIPSIDNDRKPIAPSMGWEKIVSGALSLTDVEEMQRREAEERYRSKILQTEQEGLHKQKEHTEQEHDHAKQRFKFQMDHARHEQQEQQPEAIQSDKNEQNRKDQQRLQTPSPQQIAQLPELPKKAVWGNPTLSAVDDTPTPLSQLSIAQIQKMQEEKEFQESELRKQQMAAFIANQNNGSDGSGSGVPLKWASTGWQEPKTQSIKTLAEIQAEESAKAARLREQQDAETRRRMASVQNSGVTPLASIVAKGKVLISLCELLSKF